MFEIPFRIASHNAPLILLAAQINGEGPFDFVMDSGNGAPLDLLISPSLQGKAGLIAEPAESSIPIVSIDSIQFGGWTIRRAQAGVLEELDQISAKVGASIVGNVGYHALKSWRIEIDYARQLVRLGGDATRARAGTAFESGPEGAFILLPVFINDSGPFRFLLDTGASTTVLSPRLAKDFGIKGAPIEAMGVQGDLAAESITLKRLEAAGQVVMELEAGIIDVFEYTSRAAGVQVDGILGHTFLKQFCVVIDYPQRTVMFQK
jgi:hypothetical protein